MLYRIVSTFTLAQYNDIKRYNERDNRNLIMHTKWDAQCTGLVLAHASRRQTKLKYPTVIFDRLINFGYEQQAHSNLTVRMLLTVMPASMPSRASVFSSSVSSPSKIPLMYDPNTPSSVFKACSLLLNQQSKEFVATAMFGFFNLSTSTIGNACSKCTNSFAMLVKPPTRNSIDRTSYGTCARCTEIPIVSESGRCTLDENRR